MKQEFETDEIKHNERAVFEIWHDRFVNEYNKSNQHRQGHILNLGTPQDRWDESFENNVPPLWIKYGKRNIGFVCPQSITIGVSKEKSQQIQIVSDVYVDPKFRGRGLLTAVLMSQREEGRKAILIDAQKLLDNGGYYYMLGFRYMMLWPEQELLIVSPEPLFDPDIWTKMEFTEETVE